MEKIHAATIRPRLVAATVRPLARRSPRRLLAGRALTGAPSPAPRAAAYALAPLRIAQVRALAARSDKWKEGSGVACSLPAVDFLRLHSGPANPATGVAR